MLHLQGTWKLLFHWQCESPTADTCGRLLCTDDLGKDIFGAVIGSMEGILWCDSMVTSVAIGI